MLVSRLGYGGRALLSKCRRLAQGKRNIHNIDSSDDDRGGDHTGFTEDEEEEAQEQEEQGRRVVIVWDITTSKPPVSMDPQVAALRVRDLADAFGFVVDRSAYAEPRIPVTDARPRTYYEEKLMASQLKPVWYQDVPHQSAEDYVYKCGYCGRTLSSHHSLYKHFKQIHAPERAKRVHKLNRIHRGQRRDEYALAMADKEQRYRAALREIVMPKLVVSDELCSALTRAGFLVRLVTEKPLRHLFLTAQESAVINHLWQAAWLNVACIVLVSDSCRFGDFIRLAREQRGVKFVGISDGLSEFRMGVDLFISWEEIERGRGYVWATEAARAWFSGPRLFAKRSTLRKRQKYGGGGEFDPFRE
ncbi:hypothetical protein SELMODRAFT_420162 [Selaginella moellendorffii]|uniref:C2H2-type domain-containing protein n=1 Tax=Selaginella moellendorffii TaxID=88036 RepID=D8SB58_SELML|nr:uncharacterized protein LOC9656304 [Selaginella moellendorffii]EFJ18195.1 hypothetical protein SELMODRAFT_420162 [Selaginella moellendorffii]|eukprot:XP_002980544.1 uncharacterized protein LOC9656304 [Selaginella moellendorffii]